ncbi:MAG TPA: 6-pyruvoyl-tetrahydropterin synthase-related protein [Candidatus Saccharimonadales bacterium]|nr:6-pyruvoyl-tetrahydropterin synthase-related protein [Candidatus Saccharimonadales bacterium]
MLKKFLFPVLSILFAFIAGFSLLHSGLPPTHDGEYHVIRFFEFDKMLRSGTLYPRWAPDLNFGFGVPLFTYVYPLPSYVASLFHGLGFSFIDAFKLNMFAATLVGGLFFFLFARKNLGNWGGLVSSVFYTFSPYHFVDIYIRGSVGEVWALAFFPAFFWSGTKMFEKRGERFVLLTGVFLALIVFSHNILALMFFPFALSYLVFLFIKSKEKHFAARRIIISLVLGIGLSAIFFVPALLETKFVKGLEVYDVSQYFPQVFQLIFPSWGAGIFGGSDPNQMSVQIGITNLVAVFTAFFVWLFLFLKRKKETGILLFFLIWFILIFFLMLPVSLFIWQKVPLMNYFQFPWRFLSLEILIASFLSGSLLKIWNKWWIAAVLIFLAVILTIGYSKPAYYLERSDNYYTTRPNFIDGTNSIGNVFNTKWANLFEKRENQKIVFDGAVKNQKIQPTHYEFSISSSQNQTAIVNAAYFPGWKVFIDKNEVKISPSELGLITFPISSGNHAVEVQLGETNIQTIAKLISFISLLIILGLFFRLPASVKR